MRVLPFFVSLCLASTASAAFADGGSSSPSPSPPSPPSPPPADYPAAEEEVDEDANLRRVYLSISPIHLLFPIVEVTGEVRLHRKIGVAGIAGIGSIDPDGFSAKAPGAPDAPRFTAWEVGGQFVGYPVGTFDHGLQIGAEVLYVGVAGSQGSGGSRVVGTGEGLAMGPFVGYKLATRVGFSFNVQAGAQYLAVRAEASSATRTANDSDAKFVPLLNLNVGWSF